MRLWHIDLLEFLPNAQLVKQWKDCATIAGAIKNNGTPNHLLINKVLDYPWTDFVDYTNDVMMELLGRDYNVSEAVYHRIKEICANANWSGLKENQETLKLFKGWHNKTYLKQCLFTLEEQYNCGGISYNEWERVSEKFYTYFI
jgi:uncharacterized protein (TIGR02328 family)